MIDYNISKYIDTDEPNAEPNTIDSTEALNAVDITDNAEIPNTEGTDDTLNNDEATENDTEVQNTKEYKVSNAKVPDILGNNKLGYNIWDTIVKGV